MDDFINFHFGALRVYVVADLGPLFNSRQSIARDLFDLSTFSDRGRTFSIHPVSGYIFYADHSELWNAASSTDFPRDSNEAEKIARNFIEEANAKLSVNRQLREAGFPSVFPSDLRRIWVGAIIPQGHNTPGHWLCQFGVFLAVDQERTARVEGAVIDIRIGRKGKILGLNSRWRPLTGDVLSSELVNPADLDAFYSDSPFKIRKPQPNPLPPIIKPDSNAIGFVENSGKKACELLFWLADENSPQYFLAPTYLARSGHHSSLRPASLHSLHADIWQRSSDAGMELLAVVGGGSGNYAYQWGHWTLDTFFETGITLAGMSQTVFLEPGVSNVLLHVKDTLTGAVAQAQKSVYPKLA